MPTRPVTDGMMALIFIGAYVYVFRKLIATVFIGTYIHRVLVIDGYWYTQVFFTNLFQCVPLIFAHLLFTWRWLKCFILPHWHKSTKPSHKEGYNFLYNPLSKKHHFRRAISNILIVLWLYQGLLISVLSTIGHILLECTGASACIHCNISLLISTGWLLKNNIDTVYVD